MVDWSAAISRLVTVSGIWHKEPIRQLPIGSERLDRTP
jgi:hypothetical protein